VTSSSVLRIVDALVGSTLAIVVKGDSSRWTSPMGIWSLDPQVQGQGRCGEAAVFQEGGLRSNDVGLVLR